MSGLSGILYAPDPSSRDRWIALDAPLDERAARRIGAARRDFEAEERRQAKGSEAQAREQRGAAAAVPTAPAQPLASGAPAPGRLLVPLAGGLQVLTLGAAAEQGEANFAARAAKLGSEAYRKAGAEPSLEAGHMGLVSLRV